MQLRSVNITRYITPLREGGSLPAITEADDGAKYVIKFKGAGQGSKALIAELIGGELARRLGFLVPEIVFANLDEGFGRTEPDEEIQDLLKASTGLNLGLTYLSSAITLDPVVTPINEMVASMIVWLDAFITNVDRTVRNTNMLMWKGDLWLIDHGAALFFHHNWDSWEQHATKPYPLIKNHVLLPVATKLHEANEIMKNELNGDIINEIVNLIPDEWLPEREGYETPQEIRQVYANYLLKRLAISDQFTKEAIDAR
ncbi:MAG TPA: aminotransferase class I and II [Saprospiraceae bacterium]|nr:aminotransferase class I and II [Saprospiraceae bacterium]